ncbi:hypothetical protein MAR_033219 [Mya arenaria]|uniref:NADH dehydrogenase subunit 6 n=1 Tax=Mya arenaria TaxID=6604 RepID=A0ABY7G9T2_MYAAR|nr:hypothetical protein MAR_033219 [Mya arenaria]
MNVSLFVCLSVACMLGLVLAQTGGYGSYGYGYPSAGGSSSNMWIYGAFLVLVLLLVLLQPTSVPLTVNNQSVGVNVLVG